LAVPGAQVALSGLAGRKEQGGFVGHWRARRGPVTGSLRILVDGRVMQDRYHGIGRYTYELLRELSRAAVDLVVLCHPDSGRLGADELMTRRNVRAVPSRVPVQSLRSQWVLARAVQVARPDVVFVPYHLSTPLLSGRVPVVSVVHDCVLERDAAARGQSAFSQAYHAATRLAIRSATALAAPSAATRDDIRRFYGVELPQECVVPYGVGAQFFALAGQPRPRPPGLPDRYILHVGAQRPHKNQAILVEALAMLQARHPGVGLVLVGQPDPRFPDYVGRLVATHGLSDLVRRPAYVDDAALLDLYANASAFAYPSLVEGFGMPVLEAMAAGLAVVASDAEAVREVAGGGALIVPARVPGAWAGALGRVLADPRLARHLGQRGQAVAAGCTWACSAERTLALLTRAARSAGVTTGEGGG
jgi:glycosyltransferase involved in cell wall biosynthesis